MCCVAWEVVCCGWVQNINRKIGSCILFEKYLTFCLGWTDVTFVSELLPFEGGAGRIRLGTFGLFKSDRE